MKILITGAGSGIALSLAFYLAQDKNNFIYVTTHYKHEVLSVKKKIEEENLSKRITCFKLDVTKKKDRNLIKKIDIDCLVNNAAYALGGSIMDLDEKEILKGFEINVFSQLELAKIFIKKPNLKNKKRTLIVTSSLLGIMPLAFLGVYSATKASLISIMTSLKNELKYQDNNIKIRLIEPGAYKTGFNDFMIANVMDSIKKSSLFYKNKEIIIKRLKLIFNLIEKKSTNSIVRRMTSAVYNNGDKLVYRSPFLQVLMMKIYMLFLK